MSERFAVVSDIQLFQRSTEICFASLRERPVEFVLVAGDVMDVFCREEDWPVKPIPPEGDVETSWAWTLEQLAGLGKPFCPVPGNHDLYTSALDPFGAADAEALDLWQTRIGPVRFAKDSKHCRIVGLNYADWTAGVQTWAAGQLDTTSKWRILMQHYPLAGASEAWLDENAASKLSFCAAHSVDLILAGHHHAFGHILTGSSLHVICPAISYLIPATDEAATTLDLVGWLEVVATSNALTIEVWRPTGKIYEFGL